MKFYSIGYGGWDPKDFLAVFSVPKNGLPIKI